MAAPEVFRAPKPSFPHVATSDPMWIYDRETLAFLVVNEAAIHNYGYTRKEFLNMTILDIRPCEDVRALLQHALHHDDQQTRSAERWRHRTKDGTILEVEIVSWSVTFDGRHAEAVIATDLLSEHGIDDVKPAAEWVV